MYAVLELSEQLNLAMIGCRTIGAVQRVQLGLYVHGENLPPELKKIEDGKEDSDLASFVCTNNICEERSWKFFMSGTGDTYFATITFPKKRQTIKSIRIILPDETMKYEYRGDIDGLLKKICR